MNLNVMSLRRAAGGSFASLYKWAAQVIRWGCPCVLPANSEKRCYAQRFPVGMEV